MTSIRLGCLLRLKSHISCFLMILYYGIFNIPRFIHIKQITLHENRIRLAFDKVNPVLQYASDQNWAFYHTRSLHIVCGELCCLV